MLLSVARKPRLIRPQLVKPQLGYSRNEGRSFFSGIPNRSRFPRNLDQKNLGIFSDVATSVKQKKHLSAEDLKGQLKSNNAKVPRQGDVDIHEKIHASLQPKPLLSMDSVLAAPVRSAHGAGPATNTMLWSNSSNSPSSNNNRASTTKDMIADLVTSKMPAGSRPIGMPLKNIKDAMARAVANEDSRKSQAKPQARSSNQPPWMQRGKSSSWGAVDPVVKKMLAGLRPTEPPPPPSSPSPKKTSSSKKNNNRNKSKKETTLSQSDQNDPFVRKMTAGLRPTEPPPPPPSPSPKKKNSSKKNNNRSKSKKKTTLSKSDQNDPVVRKMMAGLRPTASLQRQHDTDAQAEEVDSIREQAVKYEAATVTGRRGSRLAALKKQPRDNVAAAAKDYKPKKLILGYTPDQPIRARFAPSPTGYMHLGSLRTALFNNLVAKGTQEGQFIIRIEDTDQNRLVSDAEEKILEDLEWAGLSWDEGPDKGGPYGPYRQSERLPIYQNHIKTLLHNDSAYRCFCSASHLEAQKRALHDAGKPTVYPGTCRSISREESDRRAAAGDEHVVRLKSDKFGRPKFADAIYGPFQKKEAEEDFVLIKTDGFPTYHFANVVDDHLMKITHVIRGEEWLISTPKHLALYEAFGWTPPTFAHLGLLVDQDGTKLSKRNASVNLSTYRDENIFSMALLTWLANLGSSLERSKPERIPMSLQDIADQLTFKFTRGGIKLNPSKLTHYQNTYRNAVFSLPSDPSTQSLIETHLTAPLLNHLTTSPFENLHPKGACFFWPQPLTTVPSLNPVDILRRETANYSSPTDLIVAHPFYFFRVPPVVYRASILERPLPSSVITPIRETLFDELIPWPSVLPTLTAKTSSSEEVRQLHELFRLVAAGSYNAQTRGTGALFEILGRDEWMYRMNVVQGLVEELENGGVGVRNKWEEEIEGLEKA